MHRRQLIILHAVLITIAALLAWRLAADWKRANLRYRAVAIVKPGGVSRPAPAAAPAPAPPTTDIIAKNLFSLDRNNDMPKDEKPQPPPPVPVVFGTMNLGGKYEALMGDAGQTSRRGLHRIKNGELMGGYKVVEISDEKVILEYQGQKTTLNVYQSANTVPRNDTRTVAPPSPVESARTPAPQQPAVAPQPAGAPASSTLPQSANDPYLRVTVEGDRKKFERQTPFGVQTWYENIPK